MDHIESIEPDQLHLKRVSVVWEEKAANASGISLKKIGPPTAEASVVTQPTILGLADNLHGFLLPKRYCSKVIWQEVLKSREQAMNCDLACTFPHSGSGLCESPFCLPNFTTIGILAKGQWTKLSQPWVMVNQNSYWPQISCKCLAKSSVCGRPWLSVLSTPSCMVTGPSCHPNQRHVSRCGFTCFPLKKSLESRKKRQANLQILPAPQHLRTTGLRQPHERMLCRCIHPSSDMLHQELHSLSALVKYWAHGLRCPVPQSHGRGCPARHGQCLSNLLFVNFWSSRVL